MHGSAREDTAGSRKQELKHRSQSRTARLRNLPVKFRSMQDEFMALQVHTQAP